MRESEPLLQVADDVRDGRADVAPQFNAFARQMFGEAPGAFQALRIEGAKIKRVVGLR